MRIVLLVALTACSSSSTEDVPVNCATETRAQPLLVNTDAVGEAGTLDFKILSDAPAPPARNENAWVLQINSMASGVVGAPVTGAALQVSPWMPDHQHSNGIPVDVTPMPDAGQYKLDPLFLGMPGYWEITVEASAGSTDDSVVYKICIPS